MSQKPEDNLTGDPENPTAKPASDTQTSETQSTTAKASELSVDEYDIDLDGSSSSYVLRTEDIPSSGLNQEATDLTIDQGSAGMSDQTIDQSSVGAWVASERARQHMSVTEVANRLKLSPEQINLLEANAFDQLAAPVFVRGYLNNYARLLNLPVEAVLQQYKAEAQPESYVYRREPDQAPSTQPRKRFRFDRLILFGMILLLGYYAYRYLPWGQWFGNDVPDMESNSLELQDVPEPPPSSNEGVNLVTTGAATDSANIDNATIGSASNASALSSGAGSINSVTSSTVASGETGNVGDRPEVIGQTAEIAETSGNPSVTVNDSEELVVDAPRSISATTAVELLQPMDETLSSRAEFVSGNTELYTADGQSVGSLQPSIDTETLTRAVAQRRFKLTFNADCWVEARDSEGEKLLIGTIKRGATRTFDSIQPVSFVLGKPDAVSISIDGEVIDKDSYIKPGSGVSRFKL